MEESITFPTFKLWDNECSQLEIANSQDLNAKALLKRIGGANVQRISLTPVTDRTEITRRQRLCKFLMSNQLLLEELIKFNTSPKVSDQTMGFLQEFSPKCHTSSRFMDQVLRIWKLLQKSENTTPEITKLVNFLDSCMPSALRNEARFSKAISREVFKAAEFVGTVSCTIDAEGLTSNFDGQILGYRLHCHKPHESRRLEVPEWANQSGICSRTAGGVLGLVYGIWNSHIDRREYGGQVIKEVPESVKSTIKETIHKFCKNSNKPLFGGLSGLEWRVVFSVEYLEGSLQLKVIDIEPNFQVTDAELCKADAAEERRPYIPPRLRNFPGYSSLAMYRFERMMRKLKTSVSGRGLRAIYRTHGYGVFYSHMQPLLTRCGIEVTSPALKDEFGYHALQAIFANFTKSEAGSVYKCVSDFRNDVFLLIQELKDVAHIVSAMQSMAEKWDFPLEFPQILGGDGIMMFKSLHPVHLVGQKRPEGVLKAEDIVPITGMPKINGRLAGLTGQNAGGKTVAMESMVEFLYLAQTGLPVFGEGLALNPKSVIALVFIERGDGSTAQLLVDKIAALMESISKHDPKKAIVFIDELGTGTQHECGANLGRRVLATLEQKGISVVFATQITDLAIQARDNLNSIILKIDENHALEEGIGQGNIELLVKRSGLEEYLVD